MVVKRCVYQEDALVLMSMLESAGIEAVISSSNMLDVSPLYSTSVSGFALEVPDEDGPEAAEIAAAFDAAKTLTRAGQPR